MKLYQAGIVATSKSGNVAGKGILHFDGPMYENKADVEKWAKHMVKKAHGFGMYLDGYGVVITHEVTIEKVADGKLKKITKL